MPGNADQPKAAADWGTGEASTPRTVKVDIKTESFVAEGDARAIQELYLQRNAALYALLKDVGLGIVSLLMLVLAVVTILYAPPTTVWLAPWIALPATVLALAIGGFTVFRISATKGGFEASGGHDAGARRHSTPPKRQPRERSHSPRE